jgi:NTE family protein
MRTATTLLSALLATLPAPAARAGASETPANAGAPRPRVGVAFGGGSARGLAHVGVIRWFEEHRVPIDLVAGTSMGGLIGGGFASGMSAEELSALLAQTDWDEMFGSSPFRYKNVRRKEDARAYPSRIEFGVKHGIALPLALNNGQQVDFLLARIAGPYATLPSFDELPSPFRAVAVDLVTAEQVVLDRGVLASAMRATMSLPGIFPPVERDGRVLVDGGALNNVPADVVRAMGADVVVAVNVGHATDPRKVSRSLLGLMSQTVDVMMQASTRAAMRAADVVITPTLEDFASLDWRRSGELDAAGYRAAEALKEKLLPLALDEPGWAAYQEARKTRRKTELATPQFLSVVGAVPSDQLRIERVLSPSVGKPLDLAGLERNLASFAGLDRYETVGWQLEEAEGRYGLRVEARPKAHAPPFLMLGVSLENTTSDHFAFEFAARYLTFDAVGSGSELRADAAVGAQPSFAAELYRPIGGTPLFAAAWAGVSKRNVSFFSDDVVVAQYSQIRMPAGIDLGANVSRDSDVRVGISYGRLDADVEGGDPGLPELHGSETRARFAWRFDDQDSPVVPSGGVRVIGTADHIFDAPDPPPEFLTDKSNDDVTQAELRGSAFWSLRRRGRVFVAGGGGTTWGSPLATEQFALGGPLRLGAYNIGEFRGDHYGVLSAGYLRRLARLPDFLGSWVFAGAWVESGSVFDDLDAAKLKTNASLGALADTLIGPVLVGASFDFQGSWRYYIAIGRVF